MDAFFRCMLTKNSQQTQYLAKDAFTSFLILDNLSLMNFDQTTMITHPPTSYIWDSKKQDCSK